MGASPVLYGIRG